MRQQTGKVTAQLKLKTLNDNPYIILFIVFNLKSNRNTKSIRSGCRIPVIIINTRG